VAHLGNSSTEDYGLDVDTKGNALLAFLDTREGTNPQVTTAKMSPAGKALWGKLGVQLTHGQSASNSAPKIAGTSDGDVVVAWTSNSNVVLQKLDPNGHPLWGKGVVLHESGYNYGLADLHAAAGGSVIVSWTRDHGFGSDRYLYANKLSAKGQLLWGKGHVHVLDSGSLQFGNFPYFVPDRKGGAVFAWYTSSPSLQCFAQHIRADGSEAFPHNGSPASTNTNQVRVSPAGSYREATDEVFLFWTEEDSNQVLNGVYGQKFNSTGAREWGDSGLTVVPLGADQQVFVQNVRSAPGPSRSGWIKSGSGLQPSRQLGSTAKGGSCASSSLFPRCLPIRRDCRRAKFPRNFQLWPGRMTVSEITAFISRTSTLTVRWGSSARAGHREMGTFL
jgi:hypothetical protein